MILRSELLLMDFMIIHHARLCRSIITFLACYIGTIEEDMQGTL